MIERPEDDERRVMSDGRRMLRRVSMLTCPLRFALFYRFFFPDSPANAWFLTPEERVIAVERIKVNQAGVENKHFKREQYVFSIPDERVCTEDRGADLWRVCVWSVG